MVSSDDLNGAKDNVMIATSSQKFVFNLYAAIILRAH